MKVRLVEVWSFGTANMGHPKVLVGSARTPGKLDALYKRAYAVGYPNIRFRVNGKSWRKVFPKSAEFVKSVAG